MHTCDFLIIGGGVIGLTLAMEAKRRHSDSSVVLLEKETELGMHASGRNSGVLHAGFYYTADSLKARFTRDGNAALRAYCQERGLRINRCGKLIVTANSEELDGLQELKRRGDNNGVDLNWITESEAREIEPRVITHEAALFSPTTASVDPREVVAALISDAKAIGIDIRSGVKYLGKGETTNEVSTSSGCITAGYIINAAGLYADRVAMDFGFSDRYCILPFKGLYLYAGAKAYRPKTNIYPVPNLAHPFLGVHFTMTVDGYSKIGPTAIPAFWREHYKGLDRFDLQEFMEISFRELRLFIRNTFGFRRLAIAELQKYYKPYMISEATKMLQGAESMNFCLWGEPGIRAQLVDMKAGRLEMDFKFEGDDRSFHVLNAVSPAFTCSIPFSSFLFDEIDKLAA